MKYSQLAIVALGVAGPVVVASPAFAGVTGTGNLELLGKCMDAPNGQSSDGTNVNLYDCNGGTNQVWILGADGTIRPAFDQTKCLDLPDWQTDNGTLLNLWDCNGGSNQQWSLDGDSAIRGYGAKCVDDPSGSTDNGVSLLYYDCNGGSNQQLSLVPVQSPPVNLEWDPAIDVGGHVSLTVFPDGGYDFFVSFHQDGFFDENVGVVCVIKDSDARGYSLTFTGHMCGTESCWLGGSRVTSGTQSSSSDMLRNAWWQIETEQQRNGDAIQCTAQENEDFTSLANTFYGAVGVAGTVLGIVSLAGSP